MGVQQNSCDKKLLLGVLKIEKVRSIFLGGSLEETEKKVLGLKKLLYLPLQYFKNCTRQLLRSLFCSFQPRHGDDNRFRE